MTPLHASGNIRQLGDLIPTQAATPAMDDRTSKHVEAAAIAVSAIGSILGLVLYATGQHKAAAAIGATGILVSSTLGIVRVLGS